MPPINERCARCLRKTAFPQGGSYTPGSILVTIGVPNGSLYTLYRHVEGVHSEFITQCMEQKMQTKPEITYDDF
ncbi:MAG TPA: hypothetical protein DCM28_21770, partial [Phycisphaerales bacterium]|nr:hypothetical protein [Phycisphaerales bacterium]